MGHGPVDLAETVDQHRFLLQVQLQLASQRSRRGIPSHIVFSGPQAAAQDDDVGTVDRTSESALSDVAVVTHNVLTDHFHAQQVQLLAS